MSRACALAAGLLVCGSALAQKPEIFHDKDPSRWGSPLRIVKPEYPQQALEQRVTGYVDFEGVVTDEGTIIDISYRPESPHAEVFVPAVKEVVPHWVFYPAIGTDCMPGPQRYITRVWFELEDDKPKISVTRRVDAERQDQYKMMKPLSRVHPRYPRYMIDKQNEALVYARAEVEPDGTVSTVEARVYPPDRSLGDFERSVRAALLQWRFEPAPARRIYCTYVDFRLR